MDFVSVVRVCLTVAVDLVDPELRILANVKTNIGPKPKSLVFELITQKASQPILKWRGESDLTADDLENPDGQSNDKQVNRAVDFLLMELASGPVATVTVKRKARALGISNRTLDRAKKDEGIRSKKVGKIWKWRLPKTPNPQNDR